MTLGTGERHDVEGYRMLNLIGDFADIVISVARRATDDDDVTGFVGQRRVVLGAQRVAMVVKLFCHFAFTGVWFRSHLSKLAFKGADSRAVQRKKLMMVVKSDSQQCQSL